LLTLPPSELRGALRPRVEHRPITVTGSEGYIGVDLMAAAGKPLEQWQADSVDLMMSTRADGKWSCFEYAEWVARQNGKGGIGEARVLSGLFVLGEELLIWSAHEYKTALEAFRRIRALIRALGTPINDTLIDVDGVMVKVSNTNGEEGFERLDTEQRLKFIARSKGSGRGFSGDVNIIDEAFAYTSDQAEALGPTLIARKNPQIVYLSSPPLSSTSGEVMFELKKRAEAGNDDSLGYRDFGLAGDLDNLGALDIDDPRNWAAANPALGLGRVTMETIGRLRKMLSANNGRGFAREVLGVWPKQHVGGGGIDLDKWMPLMLAQAQRSGDVSLAVDIAPDRKYAAIGMFARTEDGAPFVRLLSYRPGVDWLIDSIVEWRTTLDPIGIAMGRGTYASIGTDLEKAGIKVPDTELGPRRGDVCALNSVNMSAACGQFIDGVNQGSFRWVPDDAGAVLASVRGAKTKLTGDTIAWSRKEADTDTSPLVSITAAKWLHGEWAHLVDKQNTQPFFGAWR